MAPRDSSTDPALAELRAFGLKYPGAHTKSPWPGHKDLAVNDKTFAYLSAEGDPFTLSCKLPQSSEDALSLPFVTPTAYGLGKSGWVTAQLSSGPVPLDLFKAWLDESYRAQAPKRLVATLAAAAEQAPAAAPRRGAAGKKRTAKTTAKIAAPKVAKKAAKQRAGKKAPASGRASKPLAHAPRATSAPEPRKKARARRAG